MNKILENSYEHPSVEVIEIEVEGGFATSGDLWGDEINDFGDGHGYYYDI